MSEVQPNPDLNNFTFDPSVVGWNTTGPNWLKTNNKTWHALASGAMVFDTSNRLLLIQRAAHDSMPNRWETPGGAIDNTDATVLHGCVRELWEEAGLVATRVNRIVTEGPDLAPGTVFTDRTGKRFYCKFSFEVDVEDWEVKLDPNEHQDYVWVTEEEAKAQRIGERAIPFTTAQMVRLVAEAFRLRKLGQEEKAQVAN